MMFGLAREQPWKRCVLVKWACTATISTERQIVSRMASVVQENLACLESRLGAVSLGCAGVEVLHLCCHLG